MYVNQLGIGALIDQDGGLMQIFDQDDFDLDIGPLDDLSSYTDPKTSFCLYAMMMKTLTRYIPL